MIINEIEHVLQVSKIYYMSYSSIELWGIDWNFPHVQIMYLHVD